jgi:hypothetical protein
MAGKAIERLRRFAPFVALGGGLLALLVAAAFWLQRGAHLELKGSIGKVRTLPLPDGSTVVVIDFRLKNIADYPFVVRRVDVWLDAADGRSLQGAVASEPDAERLFTYYPILGQKYNSTLVARTRFAPKESLDRMVAARFELPEEAVLERRNLRIRVEDVDGAVSELAEHKR